MLIAGLGTPLIASVADRTGHAGRYNAVAALGCIASMAMIGLVRPIPLMLIFFFLGTIFYQAALVFYNTLLPSVASERHMGLVSGLGVGLGYIGTVLTLFIALPIQQKFGFNSAFIITAALFLIFASPCMLFVRDLRCLDRQPISLDLFRRQWGELLHTVRSLPEYPALMWFLLANFFAVDVLGTSILFYARFLKDAFGPMIEADKMVLLGYPVRTVSDFLIIGGLAVNIPALAFGTLTGHLADRFGARKLFVISVASLTLGLLGSAVFGGWQPLAFLISICCFGGVGLAGIWTVGRKLLIQLVPRELVARFFGLYGITTKLSVVGSAVCGVIMQYFGYRIAILSLVVPLALTFWCLAEMNRSK